MPRPPKKKRPTYLWAQQLSRVTVEQLEQHLDSQPVFASTTSQLHRCQLCLGNLDGHRMRYRLLECRSPACTSATTSAGLCNAWIKTLSCATTERSSVFHHGAHANVDQTTFNRMTLQLKRHTKTLAATGAKPMAILSDMIGVLNLTADTVPRLSQVQTTAYHHKKVLLLATALVSQMRETVRVNWYRADLDETTPFVFACPIDHFGIPVIGNGSEATPFLVGVTTKRQVRGLSRASAFPFHIDATYKINQSGYPMVVCGTSDASRSMHVAAVFLTSHLRQEQYTSVFTSMFSVYHLVTASPLKVRYVMGDADDAQFNGFVEAVIPNCPGATYLMCFFHVMLNVKKRARELSECDRKLVYKHVYRIHQTRNEFDASDQVAAAVRAWSARQSLQAFLRYFSKEWLDSRFNRWQCYQSAVGHAKTNNPLEQFNKAFKRDYTLRQLLPLNSLMLKMKELCKTKAVAAHDFKESSTVTPDLPRRLKYLRKAGLFSHKRVQRASLSFIMDDNAIETHVLIKQHGVQSNIFPLTKTDQERLPSLYMETYGEPQDGWYVNVAEKWCPCAWSFKFGCCVHLLEALEIVGAAWRRPDQGEEVFVSQRRRHATPPRRVTNRPRQGGRPTQVGPALAME